MAPELNLNKERSNAWAAWGAVVSTLGFAPYHRPAVGLKLRQGDFGYGRKELLLRKYQKSEKRIDKLCHLIDRSFASNLAEALNKRLHRYPVKGKRRSRSKALFLAGYVASSGKPFGATAIVRMVEAPSSGPGATQS